MPLGGPGGERPGQDHGGCSRSPRASRDASVAGRSHALRMARHGLRSHRPLLFFPHLSRRVGEQSAGKCSAGVPRGRQPAAKERSLGSAATLSGSDSSWWRRAGRRLAAAPAPPASRAIDGAPPAWPGPLRRGRAADGGREHIHSLSIHPRSARLRKDLARLADSGATGTVAQRSVDELRAPAAAAVEDRSPSRSWRADTCRAPQGCPSTASRSA